MALASVFDSDYQYLPLGLGGDPTIRLLSLLPDKFDDELRVRISTQKQRDDLDYEALSYAWGPEHDWASSRIRVHDSQRPWQRRVLKISSALETALRHLRREDATRTLWIDAICINQADLQERGHQVRLMGDIYRRASRVVAWLGPLTDSSKHALEFLKLVSTCLQLEWSGASSLPMVVDVPSNSLDGKSHWLDEGVPFPFNDMPLEYAAFRELVGRPWFERLWIRQEIILGSPASVVQCGTDEISWR